MFKRIATWLGFNKKKDEVLARRFDRMRRRYGETTGSQSVDVVNAMRTTFETSAITGIEKTTAEQYRKNLIELYARTAENRVESTK